MTRKKKDEDVNTEAANDRPPSLSEIAEAVSAWREALVRHPDSYELGKAKDRLEKAVVWIQMEMKKS